MKPFFVLILGFFSFVCCHKDKNPDGSNPNTPKNIIRCDPTMVAYFGSYTNGTWWAYEEKKYKLLDTAKITNFAQSWYAYINPPPEVYHVTFKGKYIDETTFEMSLSTNNRTEVLLENFSQGGGPRVYWQDGLFKAENRFGGDTAIYYPFYKVGDKNFADVLLITDSAPYDSFFFAKNIGMVKKTQGDHTFLLKSYNIVKPK